MSLSSLLLKKNEEELFLPGELKIEVESWKEYENKRIDLDVPIQNEPKIENHYKKSQQTTQRTKYPGTIQVGANGEKRKIYQCSECAFYSHRYISFRNS